MDILNFPNPMKKKTYLYPSQKFWKLFSVKIGRKKLIEVWLFQWYFIIKLVIYFLIIDNCAKTVSSEKHWHF